MADWSGLPFDIIHEISTYLITIEDFLSFSAVCHSWRSVYLAKQWHPGPQIPLLMWSDYANSSSRSFISLYTNRVYNSEIPEIRGRRCWGSSTGWLVTIGDDLEIHLLNPFTRVSICLPPTFSLQMYFGEILDWYDIIKKAYVFRLPCSSDGDGNEDDLVVMIIYGYFNQLAFCRPGYSSWRSVTADDPGGFWDVTCLKGQIFAVGNMGSLVVIDVECVSVIDISIQYNPPLLNALSLPLFDWVQVFLVESSGDLWLVFQIRNGNHRRTSISSVDFRIYSFDFSQNMWLRLSNLGDRTIFVGANCSVAASTSAPDLLNCKNNSVCFLGTRTDLRWPHGVVNVYTGVYSMERGVSEPLRFGPDAPKCYSFPLWVAPTLY